MLSGSEQPLKRHFVVSGGASVRQYHILNDKQHVITKDTENNVAVYDVLTVRELIIFIHRLK